VDEAGLAGAEVVAIPVRSALAAVAAVFWLSRLGAIPAWDLSREGFFEPDFLNPQERAIDGPAVYPTTAPATKPTGPNTTAPDRAPKAASPPRPSARAAGTNVKNIADARTSLFIRGSRRTL
jgi:hypothetical protein